MDILSVYQYCVAHLGHSLVGILRLVHLFGLLQRKSESGRDATQTAGYTR